MNLVDLVVVLLVLVLALRGLRRGLVREVFTFAGWVAGAVAAVWLVFDLAPLLAESFRIPAAVGGLIAFVGVFFGVSLGFWLIGWLVGAFIRVTVVLRPLDRGAGLLLGAAEGLFLAGIVTAVFRQSPLFPTAREHIETSALGSALADQTATIFAAIRAEATAKDPATGNEVPESTAKPRRKPRPPGAAARPRTEP